MKRTAAAALTVLALVVTIGAWASAGAEAPPADRPVVVTTIAQIADIVKNVAGERVEADALLGEGVDPHLYKLTRSDMAKMSAADLVLYNGLLLEGKMTDALVRIAASGRPVVPVTQRIEEEWLLEPEQFQGHYDPHVWMDPTAWSRCVEVVREELTRLDPAGAGVYAEGASAYAARLAELDEYTRKVLGSVPEGKRVLVTAHDAFNYFGRRYGYEVLGIQGISTESEAGVREIERLVSILVERRIPAVFVETTVPERSVRALVAGARARGHEVVVGGSLFSDAMGAPGTYEGTYIGMIDHNVTAIARALGGAAPERGMSGLLAAPAGAR